LYTNWFSVIELAVLYFRGMLQDYLENM